MEIAGNYPDNIRVHVTKGQSGRYMAWMYMLRDGEIHKLMLSSKEMFDSAKEAEDCFHKLSQEIQKQYCE